jgi:hypothetical protein
MEVRKQPQIHKNYRKFCFLNALVQNFNSKSGFIGSYLVLYCYRLKHLFTKAFISSKNSGLHVYFESQEIFCKVTN